MRILRNIQGMTLLEVTIALFILAIGLLGLAGLQIVVLNSDTMGQQATMAASLAKTKLAELQEGHQITDGADQFIDKANGVTYARQWYVHPDTTQTDLYTLIVRVSWQDTLAERCVIVSTVNSQT